MVGKAFLRRPRKALSNAFKLPRALAASRILPSMSSKALQGVSFTNRLEDKKCIKWHILSRRLRTCSHSSSFHLEPTPRIRHMRRLTSWIPSDAKRTSSSDNFSICLWSFNFATISSNSGERFSISAKPAIAAPLLPLEQRSANFFNVSSISIRRRLFIKSFWKGNPLIPKILRIHFHMCKDGFAILACRCKLKLIISEASYIGAFYLAVVLDLELRSC